MNPLTLVKRIQSINAKESDLGISEEASWHAKYKNSAYVFVGGLPYDLTEGDLLAVFAQFCNKKQMTVLKRYVLRLFMSIKYITANVIDRNNGRVVTTASTVEHSIKNSLECGRTCNAKAAAIVGEVLAMRLKVEGLQDGQGRGIHADVKKEIEKKGFKSRTKVWAVINSLRNNGITLVLDDYVVDKAYHDRPYGDHR